MKISEASRAGRLARALFALLCAALLAGFAIGCSGLSSSGSSPAEGTAQAGIEEDGYYYDVESVALYYDRFDALPQNYITKDEARELGWQGGSVQEYMEGAAIGGDRFGNYEGLLPQDASYIECDIDTDGKSSRGAKRLIISDEGDYYYTSDHYESFEELAVEDGEVVWL